MKSIIAYTVLLTGIMGGFGIMAKEKVESAKIKAQEVTLMECSGGMSINTKGEISQEEMICIEK